MRRFWIMSAFIVTLSGCVPAVGRTYNDNGPALLTTHSGQPGAKIILLQGYGYSTRTADLARSTSAEALNAMDAAGFVVTTFDYDTRIGTEFAMMQGKEVSQETLQAQLAELPKGITKEVYIEVVMDRPGDLLDDRAWTTVATNFMNLSKAAVELNNTGDYNFKGIVVDNEDYLGNIFNCDDYNATSNCQNYKDRMFQRGKDIMRAVLEVWPQIVVMHMHGPYTSDCERPSYIAGVGVPCFDLKGSFFAGMVQVVSETPGAHPLLNGGQDYILYSSNDFQKHYDYMKAMGEKNFDFIPRDLRSVWDTHVDTSFMVYNRKIVRSASGQSSYPDYKEDELETPRVQLQNARCVADSIVWFYIEDAPEDHWYYAMPQNWRDEVLKPALEYTCPDTSQPVVETTQ
ncbi:MAG: hypothetical protein ACRCYY_08825 [Trueperaceae bacterium]